MELSPVRIRLYGVMFNYALEQFYLYFVIRNGEHPQFCVNFATS
jgi:hypothetical protein